MITSIFLILCILCLIPLFLYALLYLFSALNIIFYKLPPIPKSISDKGDIAVVIPSDNEGIAVVDTIKTIMAQDYEGPINIYLLLKDTNDNSLESLRGKLALFEDNNFEMSDDKISVKVVFTNEQFKKDRINYILPDLSENYIAFLDADHRAHPRWISSSLAIMQSEGANAVQGKRAPLAAKSFFQVWDALQNHVGNEVLNFLFLKLKKTTFFTGTTCIFKGEVFTDEFKFPDSITEDTYLSYQLILANGKISYNPYFGSYEEVAPDFISYFSRRRRWSCGHNQTFFSSVNSIFSAEKPFFEKLQLLFHGGFYTLPLFILGQLNVFALFYFMQYTSNIQLLSIVCSIFLTLALAWPLTNNWRNLPVNFAVFFLNIFPQVCFLSIFAYFFAEKEIYYQIISFPYPKLFAGIHFIFMGIAILPILFGGFRFKVVRPLTLLFHLVLFFPILFIDVCALSLGFIDFLLGRKIWGNIKRSNEADSRNLPEEINKHLTHSKGVNTRVYVATVVPLLVFLSILANDLLTFQNCGEPKYLFKKPILLELSSGVINKIYFEKEAVNTETFNLKIINSLLNDQEMKLHYRLFLDNKILTEFQSSEKNNKNVYEVPVTMGWAKHDIKVEIRGTGVACNQKRSVSTVFKELKDKKLYVNGEPFLIKGIVPSFSTAKINIGLLKGLQQIKMTGANAIRIYHQPSRELLNLSAKLNLLIISQPDDTTWENLDIESEDTVKKLADQYEGFVKETDGYPYILIDNLGNELELRKDLHIAYQNIEKTIKRVKEGHYLRYPLAYSTFFTFIDYSSDILAINMLDSGQIYWEKALNLLSKKATPFYASEFGGFVAFQERTPTQLRITRMHEYWNKLQRAGSLGAVFFQSHDNWAQPVVTGHNDPFSPEHPDDLRGLWDHQNMRKAELEHLENIFSDFRFEIVGDGLRITNRRDYRLSKLKMRLNNSEVKLQNGLKPGGSYILRGFKERKFKLMAIFHTHKGLSNIYNYTVDLDLKKVLVDRQKLLPVSVTRERQGPLDTWKAFDSRLVGDGVYRMHMDLEKLKGKRKILLLEGVGSNLLQLKGLDTGIKAEMEIHNYRENLIDVDWLIRKVGTDKVAFRFDRTLKYYIFPDKVLTNERVEIEMQHPQVIELL